MISTNQLSIFIWSCAFGIIPGILYDIFRFLRASGFNTKLQIYIQDIVFMCLCAILTFLFAIGFNMGIARFYMYLGESIGMLTYRFTFGEISIKLFKLIYQIVRMILEFIKRQTEHVEKFGIKIFLKIKKIALYFLEKIKKIKDLKINLKKRKFESSR